MSKPKGSKHYKVYTAHLWLKEQRDKRGLTNQTLAEAAGVRKWSVDNYMSAAQPVKNFARWLWWHHIGFTIPPWCLLPPLDREVRQFLGMPPESQDELGCESGSGKGTCGMEFHLGTRCSSSKRCATADHLGCIFHDDHSATTGIINAINTNKRPPEYNDEEYLKWQR
jgi:hypothetical protein